MFAAVRNIVTAFSRCGRLRSPHNKASGLLRPADNADLLVAIYDAGWYGCDLDTVLMGQPRSTSIVEEAAQASPVLAIEDEPQRSGDIDVLAGGCPLASQDVSAGNIDVPAAAASGAVNSAPSSQVGFETQQDICPITPLMRSLSDPLPPLSSSSPSSAAPVAAKAPAPSRTKKDELRISWRLSRNVSQFYSTSEMQWSFSQQ